MPPAHTSPSGAQPLDKPADLAARIAGFEAFEGVGPEALDWLVERSEYLLFPAGTSLYEDGVPVDTMDVIVEGRYSVRRVRGGEGGARDLGEYGTGYVTGVLPFSRMTHSGARLLCLVDTYVLRLHRDSFTELVTVSYALAQNLVAQMSNRIRVFADIRSQDEKMMSLGKLSAGLAHELNNPSAAIVRSAEDLYAELHRTPESFKEIMLMDITPAETDAINAVLFARLATLHDEDPRSALERMEAQEAIEDWLDEHDLPVDESVVEAFGQARLTAGDLAAMHAAVQGRSMPPLLRWLAQNITLEILVGEIREAAGRISELVTSVKSYTHMDRDGGRQALNVHEGLRSTLTLLKHRFKQTGVTLVEDFAAGLPPVMAWGGQINQVYTNLIDNAVDAAAERAGGPGAVTVRTRARGGDAVCVEVEDDGVGVPEELRQRIFEPFFTTKEVGQGTGMGLDIVRKILDRHGAAVELDSRPGHTTFRFCLPTA